MVEEETGDGDRGKWEMLWTAADVEWDIGREGGIEGGAKRL